MVSLKFAVRKVFYLIIQKKSLTKQKIYIQKFYRNNKIINNLVILDEPLLKNINIIHYRIHSSRICTKVVKKEGLNLDMTYWKNFTGVLKSKIRKWLTHMIVLMHKINKLKHKNLSTASTHKSSVFREILIHILVLI